MAERYDPIMCMMVDKPDKAQDSNKYVEQAIKWMKEGKGRLEIIAGLSQMGLIPSDVARYYAEASSATGYKAKDAKAKDKLVKVQDNKLKDSASVLDEAIKTCDARKVDYEAIKTCDSIQSDLNKISNKAINGFKDYNNKINNAANFSEIAKLRSEYTGFADKMLEELSSFIGDVRAQGGSIYTNIQKMLKETDKIYMERYKKG